MKTFVKSIILFSAVVMYFLIGQWDSASAKVEYRGVSDSEREEIAEYIQTEEMLWQLYKNKNLEKNYLKNVQFFNFPRYIEVTYFLCLKLFFSSMLMKKH